MTAPQPASHRAPSIVPVAADDLNSPAGADDGRFSPPLGLWCPYCRTPFVGSVDRVTGQFAHGECPVAAVDVQRLESLARTSWFWQRFRERLDPGAATG